MSSSKIVVKYVVNSTKVCKEEYYMSFFEENKKDSKKVSEGIMLIVNVTNKNSIQNLSLNINDETITDNKVISNYF